MFYGGACCREFFSGLGLVPMSEHSPAAELLGRHLAGDNGAFAQLMEQYKSRVYSYLVRAGVPEADRPDLFQEVFIKIHRSGRSYREEYPFESWLFAITANTVRSYYRTVMARAERERFLDQAETIEQGTPEDLNQAHQTARWLEMQIAKLPLPQREVLILCSTEKMALKDAAQALDIPLNTAKTHLSRARAALAEKLQRRKLVIEREAGR